MDAKPEGEQPKSYKLTDKAGSHVAGRKVPRVVRKVKGGEEGATELAPDPKFRLELTEEAARYELLAGTIELDAPTEKAAASKPALPPSGA